jgi:YidC/Oxa1 family membrane protein insertase
MFSALFLVVFLGLQYFRSKAPVTPAPTQTQSQHQALSAASGASSASGADANTGVQAAAESTTVVENELYRITFSNRGGQVTSWILKNYRDEHGRPLDLVNHTAASAAGNPLSLYTYDSGLRSRLAQALYVVSAPGSNTGSSTAPAQLAAPGSLTFSYSGGGISVTKTFTFDATYVVRAKVTATDNGAPLDAMLSWPSALGDEVTLPQYSAGVIDTLVDNKPDQVAAKKISGGATSSAPYGWAGVSDLYFAAIFLPDNTQQSRLVTLHKTIDIPRNLAKPNGETDKASILGVAVADAPGTFTGRIFAGPKALGVLSAIRPAGGGPTLEKVVSFGLWAIISKPLFLLLHWLHGHIVGNWGWAILILTLMLNILMLPTRVMMMRSSLKMQRIQPQMDAIKARYAKYKATDPKRQEMNKEVFDLQKKEGVNMFGGCLPMLLQWPLLFGFYRMLSNVIELRQAHWLWLPDLSAPDPYHILPIFFIISMFAVQWLTPSPGVDPQQQKMMALTMPAVFGFMTWNIGSGLALYWACSNVLGIVQQSVMNRTSLGREMRAISAKRAAKKNGGGGKIINARR